MKKLAELVGRPASWRQPSALQMRYLLDAGGETAATLEFRSLFGSFATAESGDGAWTFKRVGFLQTRVTIREREGEKEIGVFHNSFWGGGGGLALPDGRRYPATTNIWQSKLEFQDESGAPQFRLKSRGVIHLAADLEILPEAAKIPELPWMILLGWYLMVMMHMDSGAAGAAAAGG